MAGRRARLDAEMVKRGLVESRTSARERIEAGAVRVDGVAVPKPASQVTNDQAIRIVDAGPGYASRGGLKLTGALSDLGVNPIGEVCLDAGAAHGGFTDVLLRAGAAHVFAVDVAYGQFAWALRQDDRVTVMERCNVRHLKPDDLAGIRPSMIVADLSFISLRKVLPALAGLASPAATVLPMVKPQFEAGPGRVGKGGVVRDPAVWIDCMKSVTDAALDLGFTLLGAAPSQAPGPAGNVEFFLHLRRGNVEPTPTSQDILDEAAAAGQALTA